MNERIRKDRSRRHFPLIIVAVFIGLLCGGLSSALAQSRQLSLADILIALRSKKAVIEEKNKILSDAVKQRGITFSLTPEIEKELGSTGAYKELIEVIREKAVVTDTVAIQKPEPVKVEVPVPVSTPPPPDAAFYRNRAATNLIAGEYDLAMKDLSSVIELKPGEAQAYFDRGFVYLKQGKADNAAADLDKGLGIDPRNVTAYVARAQIFQQKGDTANALAYFDKASNIDPSNTAAKTGSTKIRDDAVAEEKRIAAAARAAEEAKAAPRILPVGAMNGFASDLVMPVYSAIDRRMNIQGKVIVQISLNEEGKLVDAQATEGPKTLRNSALEAVRRSTFMPVLSNGKPVAASGYIVYNFVPNQ